MHKIDLSGNKFQIQRFVLLQIVLALFTILFTYKWAYQTTHIIEQNLVMNLIFGFVGFAVLVILHEFIHRILFIIFSKGEKPSLKYDKNKIIVQFSQTCFHRWQFTIIMIAPLVIISATLLALIQIYSFSSLIFMFSIHTSYLYDRCVFSSIGITKANSNIYKPMEKVCIFIIKSLLKPIMNNH
ncbi:Hypothetical protein SAV1896 [Staphylococcus epidermidis PM221]|nr:Hypothetical protein SAV1896 [Staphylococcus epidermidis PM221]